MSIVSIYQAFINLPYFWLIFIVSLVATLLTTIIYKYTTDQKQLKQIKKEMSDLKGKLKKAGNDQKKMMAIQRDMLDKNMVMMKQSFKSMLYTFIPLILVFTWMASTMAYEPIAPNSGVTVTAAISNSYPGELDSISISSIPNATFTRNLGYDPDTEKYKAAQWTMQTGEAGTYTILIESETFKQSKEILVSAEREYENPISTFKDSQLKSITVGNEKVRPLKGVPIVGGLGWLGTYIILSIVMSLLLRKVMDIA